MFWSMGHIVLGINLSLHIHFYLTERWWWICMMNFFSLIFLLWKLFFSLKRRINNGAWCSTKGGRGVCAHMRISHSPTSSFSKFLKAGTRLAVTCLFALPLQFARPFWFQEVWFQYALWVFKKLYMWTCTLMVSPEEAFTYHIKMIAFGLQN